MHSGATPGSQPRPIRIELSPLGKVLHTEAGRPLHDLLFAHGVEFPCGGRGLCKGCRIRVLAGELPVTPEDRQRLSAKELTDGWRLACRARATGDLRIELAQWEAAILSDNTEFQFAPGEGLGVAVDVGTTTLVAQLLNLRTGEVLAVRSALNDQARHGADIMSRVEFAVTEKGEAALRKLIRCQVGGMVEELRAVAGVEANEVSRVVLVGNTVMHHLFSGLTVEPLSHYPFESPSLGTQQFAPAELGWHDLGECQVVFLPCLGGFVGSDILAGILAKRLHESDTFVGLVDLGTNGEIVIGNRDGLLCASTAAGPAFEGARISMGMRASTGAISEVRSLNGTLQCEVLDQSEPRGICGSGLVDAVATALDLGLVQPTGRIAGGNSIPLLSPVSINQWDIRELQLAKGAIAAGLRILLEQSGRTASQLERIYLAGAFGNYINRASARRIGLLDFPPEKVEPSGNTALLGAKLALFDLDEHEGAHKGVLAKTRHVSLHEDPRFQEIYVDEMAFPVRKP